MKTQHIYRILQVLFLAPILLGTSTLAAQDVAIEAIVLPSENMTIYRSSNLNLLITIRNTGNQAIPSGTTVSYTVDKGTIRNGQKQWFAAFNRAIAAGESVTFPLQEYSIDFPADNESLTAPYSECVIVEVSGDINASNNTLCKNFVASREDYDLEMLDFELIKNGIAIQAGSEIKVGGEIDSILFSVKNNTTNTVIPQDYLIAFRVHQYGNWGDFLPQSLQPGTTRTSYFLQDNGEKFLISETPGNLNFCVTLSWSDDDISNNTLCKNYIIVENVTSVEEMNKEVISFVNYSEGKVSLGLNETLQKGVRAEITNQLGQKIKSEEIVVESGRILPISFNGFSKGIYYLNLVEKDGNFLTSKKFLVH